MREIEAAGGIRFTAVVHNSNVGRETKTEDVLAKREELERLLNLSGLPLLFTSAEESVAKSLDGAFALHLQKKIF